MNLFSFLVPDGQDFPALNDTLLCDDCDCMSDHLLIGMVEKLQCTSGSDRYCNVTIGALESPLTAFSDGRVCCFFVVVLSLLRSCNLNQVRMLHHVRETDRRSSPEHSLRAPWERSGLPELPGRIDYPHTHAARAGDGFVVLEPTENQKFVSGDVVTVTFKVDREPAPINWFVGGGEEIWKIWVRRLSNLNSVGGDPIIKEQQYRPGQISAAVPKSFTFEVNSSFVPSAWYYIEAQLCRENLGDFCPNKKIQSYFNIRYDGPIVFGLPVADQLFQVDEELKVELQAPSLPPSTVVSLELRRSVLGVFSTPENSWSVAVSLLTSTTLYTRVPASLPSSSRYFLRVKYDCLLNLPQPFGSLLCSTANSNFFSINEGQSSTVVVLGPPAQSNWRWQPIPLELHLPPDYTETYIDVSLMEENSWIDRPLMPKITFPVSQPIPIAGLKMTVSVPVPTGPSEVTRQCYLKMTWKCSAWFCEKVRSRKFRVNFNNKASITSPAANVVVTASPSTTVPFIYAAPALFGKDVMIQLRAVVPIAFDFPTWNSPWRRISSGGPSTELVPVTDGWPTGYRIVLLWDCPLPSIPLFCSEESGPVFWAPQLLSTSPNQLNFDGRELLRQNCSTACPDLVPPNSTMCNFCDKGGVFDVVLNCTSCYGRINTTVTEVEISFSLFRLDYVRFNVDGQMFLNMDLRLDVSGTYEWKKQQMLLSTPIPQLGKSFSVLGLQFKVGGFFEIGYFALFNVTASGYLTAGLDHALGFRARYQRGDVFSTESFGEFYLPSGSLVNWHTPVLALEATVYAEAGLTPRVNATLTIGSRVLALLSIEAAPYFAITGNFKYPPFLPSPLVTGSSYATPYPACNVANHLIEYYVQFGVRGTANAALYKNNFYSFTTELFTPLDIFSGCLANLPTTEARSVSLAFLGEPALFQSLPVGVITTQVAREVSAALGLTDAGRVRVEMRLRSPSSVLFDLDIYDFAQPPSVNTITSLIQNSTRSLSSSLYSGFYLSRYAALNLDLSKAGCIVTFPNNFDCAFFTPAAAPTNDLCASAVILSSPLSPVIPDVSLATVIGDPTVGSCALLPFRSRSVWFRFIAPATGLYSVSTCTPLSLLRGGTTLAVYTNSFACTGVWSEQPGSCVTSSSCASVERLSFTTGVSYYIVVWYSGSSAPVFGATSVQVSVRQLVPPPNDDCANAVVFTTFPYRSPIFNLTDASSIVDVAHSCLGGNLSQTPARSIWFRYFSTAAATMSFSTCSANTTMTDTVMSLFTGTSCATLSEVACSDNPLSACGNRARIQGYAKPSLTNLYVVVSARSSVVLQDMAVQLDIALSSPPTNDQCSGAVGISNVLPATTAAFDVVDATTFNDPIACVNSSSGIWFRFQPAITGYFTLSTNVGLTTVPDTVLAIFTAPGPCVGPFLQVACNNDFFGNLRATISPVELFSSINYYVLAYVYSTNAPIAGASSIQVAVSPVAPPYDVCAGAVVIPSGVLPVNMKAVSSILDATTVGDPIPSCVASWSRGVWFQYTPPPSVDPPGVYTVSTCSSTAPSLALAVFSSSNNLCTGTFTQEACSNSNTCVGGQESLVLAMVPNRTYFILAYKEGLTLTGLNIGVQITVSVSQPVNDQCTGAFAWSPTDYFGNDLFYPSTLLGATLTNDPPIPPNSPALAGSVWYSFRPAFSGSYAFDACRSSGVTFFDGVVAVYTSSNSCSGPFVPVSSNNASCTTSALVLLSDVTYYVVVWRPGTAVSVSLVLKLSLVAPVNDECINALPIESLSPVVPDVRMATINNASDSFMQCVAGGFSVWFSHVPAVTGTFSVSSCSSETNTTVFDTVLSIATGSCLAPDLVPGGCNDDSCGLQSRVITTMQAGVRYLINVYIFGSLQPLNQSSSSVQVLVAPYVPPTQPVTTSATPIVTLPPANLRFSVSCYKNGLCSPAQLDSTVSNVAIGDCVFLSVANMSGIVYAKTSASSLLIAPADPTCSSIGASLPYTLGGCLVISNTTSCSIVELAPFTGTSAAATTRTTPTAPPTSTPSSATSPVPGSWTLTGPMLVSRSGASTVLIPNKGIVLTSGGGWRSCEVFDAVSSSWASTTLPQLAERAWAPSVVLTNNLVFLAGGVSLSSIYLSSAELFFEQASSWSTSAR